MTIPTACTTVSGCLVGCWPYFAVTGFLLFYTGYFVGQFVQRAHRDSREDD
jgi:hypothetical protein